MEIPTYFVPVFSYSVIHMCNYIIDLCINSKVHNVGANIGMALILTIFVNSELIIYNM
jgi:hypothetical protein